VFVQCVIVGFEDQVVQLNSLSGYTALHWVHVRDTGESA